MVTKNVFLPPLQRHALALGNVVIVNEQADEDEAPRDGCGHTLYTYQTAVPYHINHDDRKQSRPQKYLITHCTCIKRQFLTTSTMMTENKAGPRNI